MNKALIVACFALSTLGARRSNDSARSSARHRRQLDDGAKRDDRRSCPVAGIRVRVDSRSCRGRGVFEGQTVERLPMERPQSPSMARR